MNFFSQVIPDAIIVGNTEYKINTDFRVWVDIDHLLTQSKVITPEILAKVLRLALEGNNLPPNIEDTLGAIINFYGCNQKVSKKPSKRAKTQKRIVSFTHDAALIYAAFLSQYRIDLTCDALHWWKFRALFDALTDEHKLSEVMKCRGTDIFKIKDKDRRMYVKRIQEQYRLPDNRSIEEIERDNIENLASMF